MRFENTNIVRTQPFRIEVASIRAVLTLLLFQHKEMSLLIGGKPSGSVVLVTTSFLNVRIEINKTLYSCH